MFDATAKWSFELSKADREVALFNKCLEGLDRAQQMA